MPLADSFVLRPTSAFPSASLIKISKETKRVRWPTKANSSLLRRRGSVVLASSFDRSDPPSPAPKQMNSAVLSPNGSRVAITSFAANARAVGKKMMALPGAQRLRVACGLQATEKDILRQLCRTVALTKAIRVGQPTHGPSDSNPRASSSRVDNKVADPRMTARYGELHEFQSCAKYHRR